MNHSILLILLALSLTSRGRAEAQAAPETDDAGGWLAYGDIRGHFEPCGCDPSTDLGGIKRLGIVVAREREVHPDLWLFGLGNDVPTAAEGPLKTPFLLEADARLRPTATLLNALELARAAELKAYAAGKGHALPPFVLSNARTPAQLKGLAAARIVTPRLVVLGYTEAPGSPVALEPLSDALLARWRADLAAAHGKYKVLLYSGADAGLRRAVESKLFDAVISSNASPLAALPGTAEKDDEHLLIRIKAPLEVPMVPLGGQGLLRGGILRFAEAQPLAALFHSDAACLGGGAALGTAACPPREAKPQLLRPVTLVTWLTPASASGDGPLQDVSDRYAAAARQAFLSAGRERALDLKSTPFAGAKACAECHPQQSQIYAQSAHAHAMATLQAKGKHEDPECVACHSVGAQLKGGFVSLAESPELANVQCENCHGARLAHSRDPTHDAPSSAATQPAAAVCVTCHIGQHSPAFNFATYWPRIAH